MNIPITFISINDLCKLNDNKIIFQSYNYTKYKYIITIKNIKRSIFKSIKKKEIPNNFCDYFSDNNKFKQYLLKVRRQKHNYIKRLYDNFSKKYKNNIKKYKYQIDTIKSPNSISEINKHIVNYSDNEKNEIFVASVLLFNLKKKYSDVSILDSKNN